MPSTKTPHSIAVELLAGGERAALHCQMNGHRYHLWVIIHRDNAAIFEAEDAVYKNCAKGLARGDAGYFATRTLDGTTGQGKLVRDAMLAVAADLIGKARAERHQERLQAKVREAEAARLHRVKEAGPELLAQVLVLMQSLELASSEVDWGDSIREQLASANALLARLDA